MVPDFEYPLRLAGVARFSHSLLGLVFFCLPVGMITLALFHSRLQQPLTALLPHAWRQRLPEPAALPSFWAAGRGIGAGAVTHLVWDSFTHRYGWTVEHVPALQAPLLTIAGQRFQCFYLLQYGTSLLGLLLVAAYLWRWRRQTPPRETPATPECLTEARRRGIVYGTSALALTAGPLHGYYVSKEMVGYQRIQECVEQTVVTVLVTITLCLLAYCVWQDSAGMPRRN